MLIFKRQYVNWAREKASKIRDIKAADTPASSNAVSAGSHTPQASITTVSESGNQAVRHVTTPLYLVDMCEHRLHQHMDMHNIMGTY